MAWYTRVTRLGDVHAVFGQEGNYTCSVACVIMATFKLHKITPGTRAFFSKAQILAKAESMGIPSPEGRRGFKPSETLRLLNDPEFRMTGWKYETFLGNDIPTQIIEKVGVTSGFGPVLSVKPVIVTIQWHDGVRHSVLIDTVRPVLGKKYATVCDPWDANVHIVPLEEKWLLGFRYTGGAPAVGVNFWGKPPMGEFPSTGHAGDFHGGIFWRP